MQRRQSDDERERRRDAQYDRPVRALFRRQRGPLVPLRDRLSEQHGPGQPADDEKLEEGQHQN